MNFFGLGSKTFTEINYPMQGPQASQRLQGLHRRHTGATGRGHRAISTLHKLISVTSDLFGYLCD